MMKSIKTILPTLPDEIKRLAGDSPVFDSSSSPEARVYLIDKDTGFFLKCAEAGTLVNEAGMDGYFHSLGLGPEVMYYGAHGGRDFLLTRRVIGKPLTHGDYLENPRRLAIALGERMRELHEHPADACPVTDRVSSYIDTARRSYLAGVRSFESLKSYSKFKSHEDAYLALCEGEGMLKSDTLIHGDFCLPNVIFDAWRLSGYIDLGCGGIGDRHIDIFWGLWTLNFNLKSDGYSDIFLDAYGRDKIDRATLTVVSAAESLI